MTNKNHEEFLNNLGTNIEDDKFKYIQQFYMQQAVKDNQSPASPKITYKKKDQGGIATKEYKDWNAAQEDLMKPENKYIVDQKYNEYKIEFLKK